MQSIINNFPINNEEYATLEKKFGLLAHDQAWQLKRRNYNNNMTDEQEDVVQEIRIAMIRAGSYFKRQTYIENSFLSLRRRVRDPFLRSVLGELKSLWKARTRHGANRQKFGPHQERMLERLVRLFVPDERQPSREAPLQLDKRFEAYCKGITWNHQRLLGKKITREKSWRTGLVSLNDYDYLAKSHEL
jgi:hypothetical protein